MDEVVSVLQQFHFLRPWWLAAVVVVLVVAWALKRGEHNSGSWMQVIAPELLPYLVDRSTSRSLDLKPWVVAAGVISCIALAGPTWNKKDVQLHKQSQPLIILFDLSPSMLATDLKPDRLTRAKLKTIDLLNGYREGSSALVAFAGEAHTVTPITDDTNTIISQLPVLDPGIMPVSGSSPENALNLAFELASNSGYPEGDILLITDGITTDARENLEAMLKDHSGFRLSILGVGTDEGAPIPLNEHGFARDSMGSIVIAKLGASELAGLARRSGGVYQTVTNTDQDLDSLLSPLSLRNSADTRALERRLDVWEDRGVWLVFLLLPLAILLFRKGVIFSLLLLPLVFSPDSKASVWQDLWQTRDQQGAAALDNGNPGEAAKLFEASQWRGIANHRQGNYEAAAEDFAADKSADAHYNRGNALAKAGKLEDAIKAYDQALADKPGMDDATHNRKIIEELLKQQQQQQQQQGDDPGSEGDDSSGSGENSPPDTEGEQQDQPSADNSQESRESGDQGNSGEQENTRQGEDTQRSDEETPGEAADEQNQDPAKDAPEDNKNTEQQAGDNSEEEAQSPPKEEAASMQESDGMSDEERRNAEQWLRRVPDDPGGLLRRKFEYQARQRFREERSPDRSVPGSYIEERW